MFVMDVVCFVEELIKLVVLMGYRVVVIIDYGVVQVFLEVQEVSKSCNIKVIYGMECYFIDDGVLVVYNFKEG